MDNVQLGASVGYAYSYPFSRYWLLSGAATGGLNAGVHISGEKKGNLVVMPNTFLRLSLSYNRKNWALSLLALNNTDFTIFSAPIRWI